LHWQAQLIAYVRFPDKERMKSSIIRPICFIFLLA